MRVARQPVGMVLWISRSTSFLAAIARRQIPDTNVTPHRCEVMSAISGGNDLIRLRFCPPIGAPSFPPKADSRDSDFPALKATVEHHGPSRAAAIPQAGFNRVACNASSLRISGISGISDGALEPFCVRVSLETPALEARRRISALSAYTVNDSRWRDIASRADSWAMSVVIALK